MSAPMPSLKSSMGSKGSNLFCNDPGYLCSNDERAIALRSSWINRLHLHLPFDRALAPSRRSPSSVAAPHSPCITTGSGLGHKRTISTDESRTTASIPDLNSTFVRRYFNIFSRNPPPPPPPPVPATVDRLQGGESRVTGFGPFQVRTRKTFLQSVDVPRVGDHVQNGGFPFFRVSAAAGAGDEKSKLRSMAAEEDRDPNNRSFLQPRSARLSPFFQFPLPPPAGQKTIDKGKRILSPDRAYSSSSYTQGFLRPVRVENGRPPVPLPYLLPRDSVNEQRLLVDPWRASTSAQRPVRSKGGLHHETFDDTPQCWPHANSHVLHHNSLQLHSERRNPVVLHEPEEPFSYWNLGRFNKRTTVSSVLPPTAFAGNLGRKRHSDTDDFVPSKSRKLRIEN
ncbi:hypothetical protein DsansV1_C03g0033121 [Dioscorea sansibarensis]